MPGIIPKQSRIHFSPTFTVTNQRSYRVPIAIKRPRKSRTITVSNRLPALTIIIKLSALGKIRVGELDIRHHLKMRIQIFSHIVQVGFVGNEIRVFFRSVSVQKFRRVSRCAHYREG